MCKARVALCRIFQLRRGSTTRDVCVCMMEGGHYTLPARILVGEVLAPPDVAAAVWEGRRGKGRWGSWRHRQSIAMASSVPIWVPLYVTPNEAPGARGRKVSLYLPLSTSQRSSATESSTAVLVASNWITAKLAASPGYARPGETSGRGEGN